MTFSAKLLRCLGERDTVIWTSSDPASEVYIHMTPENIDARAQILSRHSWDIWCALDEIERNYWRRLARESLSKTPNP
jgi:hypothetical protein